MRRLLGLGLLWASAAHAQIPPPTPDLTQATSCTAPCTVQITTNSYAQVNVQAAGEASGLAFTIQGTVDDGATWHNLPGVAPTVPGTFVTSFTGFGLWSVACAGYRNVRVNLTAITSGSVTFSLEASIRTNMSIGE